MNLAPKIFGINFPALTWPVWFLVFLFLVSGRAPLGSNDRSGGWRKLFYRRDKEPFGYWLSTGIFIVIAAVWTAFFNR